MKKSELFEEMLEAAKQLGIVIRKDSGFFRGGYCILSEKEIIVLNRSTSKETALNILAKALAKYSNDVFFKPVIREYIENELNNIQSELPEFEVKNMNLINNQE